ncbi:SMI1/KNR4 family protein [Archangium sp.]|uniref:SMI1/KNR4 family protein n=1 Tax=Archangium sp. TaxID=1872627 RepID=UPI00389A4CAC
MYEWLEGLQKSAKRTAAGVGSEDIRRAETECGVPFPEELGTLYQRFDGGEFQGEVHLFPLHGPEGALSVLEKTRLKLESLPAAGVWRIGVKGPHRQLFAARKSAMVEQADSPLPGWAESLLEDDWIYGTWETEQRELRLYKSLRDMLEVLVPPAEVEEFGDRTYARALSAVQGALSDLHVEYEKGEQPEEDEDEEEEVTAGAEEGEEEEERAAVEEESEEDTEQRADELLRQPVVAAAERRVGQLMKEGGEAQAAPMAPARRVVKEAAAGVKTAAKKAAAVVQLSAKAVTGQLPADTIGKGAATPSAETKAVAKKAPAKKAAAKKAPAKKAPAKKAAAKKAPAKKAAGKRGAARGRR